MPSDVTCVQPIPGNSSHVLASCSDSKMYKLDLRVKNAICDSFSLPGLVKNFTVKSDMTVIGHLSDKEFFVQKGNTRTKVESDTMPLLLPSKKLVTTSKETIKIGQKTLTLDSEI